MARTVEDAFNSFLRDSVNLDPEVVAEARDSRDNLLENIAELGDDPTFFTLHSNFNIQFGSFARGTKLRPLDDIDLMIGLSACGATYCGNMWNNIQIKPSSSNEVLIDHTNDDGTLNSIRLLNTFKTRLEHLRDYCCSDIRRNQEAIVLNLTSKDWSFDIVPCFFTKPENNGRTYFLIPNGTGNWKKTDPRLDRQYVDDVVVVHGSRVKELVRLCKYWNSVKHATTIPSYLLENIVVKVCAEANRLEQYVDWRFSNVLASLQDIILRPVYDQKRIQGDINSLSNEERWLIHEKASHDWELTQQASQFEIQHNQQAAIDVWRKVFGQEFPQYG